VAVRTPVPHDQLCLPGQDPLPPAKLSCARVAGFSLHAAQAVAAHDRAGLERLCRYGLRPPFAQERLTLREDGRVLYHLGRPWPHPQGATCLGLEPLDFMRRLAALVPAPYAHTIRYHGCFANRARSREQLARTARSRQLGRPTDERERAGAGPRPSEESRAYPSGLRMLC
jgi:hypothetical protein